MPIDTILWVGFWWGILSLVFLFSWSFLAIRRKNLRFTGNDMLIVLGISAGTMVLSLLWPITLVLSVAYLIYTMYQSENFEF